MPSADCHRPLNLQRPDRLDTGKPDSRPVLPAFYSEAMTSRLLFRPAAAAAAFAAVLLAAGCSANDAGQDEDDPPSNQEDQQTEAPDPIPEPDYDSDDTVRLPIGLVSPAGHNELAPIDDQGRISESRARDQFDQPTGPSPHQIEIARSESFGCEDTISVVRTVPVVTEDPASAALDYLLEAESPTHGDPEFINSLAGSEELAVESVEVDEDHVVVTLDGVPDVADSCEAWQVAKQIEATARLAIGATTAEVQLPESSLAEHWGLGDDSALEITEIQRD